MSHFTFGHLKTAIENRIISGGFEPETIRFGEKLPEKLRVGDVYVLPLNYCDGYPCQFRLIHEYNGVCFFVPGPQSLPPYLDDKANHVFISSGDRIRKGPDDYCRLDSEVLDAQKDFTY